ncbi:hypothetical protein ACIODT_25810 [Streptomyces sp. NPDC088251]|uniref:hypothetical protein n=1 Tax=unclassified Streptomyces TaxID=2593676 RepID=UPI0037FBB0C7
MLRSSLSRQYAGATRTAAVTGLALVSLALSAGAATASGAAPSAQRHGPAPAVQTLCTYLEAVVDRLTLPAVPAEVCTLVNGWD